MFIQLLKIEAKSFRDARQDNVRIQKVIWDHLLAFKGEIIQKQALFSLLFRTPNNSRVVLIYAVSSVFSFVLFSTSPRSFLSSKSRKESLELISSFKAKRRLELL